MDMSMGSRFKRAWNTFFNRDPTHSYNDTGPGYFYRPDRTRFSRGNERSIVTSVYNRISLDGAAISIQHVRLDENERHAGNVDQRQHEQGPHQRKSKWWVPRWFRGHIQLLHAKQLFAESPVEG